MGVKGRFLMYWRSYSRGNASVPVLGTSFAKGVLSDSGMENYDKEPTLFRHKEGHNSTGLILHADDGLLASSREEREQLLSKITPKLTVQTSAPLKEPGDEIEFLKRRYLMTEDGVIMFPSTKYADALQMHCSVVLERTQRSATPLPTTPSWSLMAQRTWKQSKRDSTVKPSGASSTSATQGPTSNSPCAC